MISIEIPRKNTTSSLEKYITESNKLNIKTESAKEQYTKLQNISVSIKMKVKNVFIFSLRQLKISRNLT